MELDASKFKVDCELTNLNQLLEEKKSELELYEEMFETQKEEVLNKETEFDEYRKRLE